MINEVTAEHGHCAPLRQHEINDLVGRGVPPIALVQDREPVLSARVVFGDAGYFEIVRDPDGEGEAAFVFLVSDILWRHIDLVAWSPKTGRTATWLGAASMLGEEQVAGYRVRSALAVHETPLDWLRAGRVGVCIVNEQKAAAALRDAGPLSAKSWPLARKLRNLVRAREPRVLVDGADETVRAAKA